MSSLAAIQLRRQNGTSTFADLVRVRRRVTALGDARRASATIAYGSYASPDYETSAEVIPAVGTKTGVPAVQSVNQLEFSLWEPAGTPPAGGWPTAIFGHGFTDSKDGAPLAVAGTLARNGIATIAINVVGHGGGALGTYTAIAADERAGHASERRPRHRPGRQRHDRLDRRRQRDRRAVADRQPRRPAPDDDRPDAARAGDLKGGVDVNGDGDADLSTSRIYYAGQSFGGIYGVQLLGLEPDIRAGVPNVPGGPIIEIARLSPAFRPLVGIALITRSPSLYNTRRRTRSSRTSTRTSRSGTCRSRRTPSRALRRSRR